MIAIIKHLYNRVVDTIEFAAIIWQDARAMQAEAEQKYGHLGF